MGVEVKCNRTQEECAKPGVCLELGCQGIVREKAQEHANRYGLGVAAGAVMGGCATGPANVKDRDPLQDAANAIRARIKVLGATHATELEYVQHRLRERDWHGLWDGAIGAAEWEIERDALLWCLEQMGCEP